METDLPRHIENLRLPPRGCLNPLFEAVVNSIQAIQDRQVEDGQIRITLTRDQQEQELLPSNRQAKILSMRVEDNGVGFTPENFGSFKILDSSYKKARGGKGVGRLLWLKAFREVYVSSTYDSEGSFVTRRFYFRTTKPGVEEEELSPADNADHLTMVDMKDFKTEYRQACTATTEQIAQLILEHCLPYFVLGTSPEIVVQDNTGSTPHLLKAMYEALSVSEQAKFKIGDHEFSIRHLRSVPIGPNTRHKLNLCADQRVVRSESILPALPKFGNQESQASVLTYTGYVTGSLLDSYVISDRSDFAFPKDTPLLEESEHTLTLDNVINEALKQSEIYLQDEIAESKKQVAERIQRIIASKPQLSHLKDKANEMATNLSSALSERELESKVHDYNREYEGDVRSRLERTMQQVLSDPSASLDETYSQLLNQVVSEENLINRSKLAEYVTHRRIILDLLSRAIIMNAENSFAKEEVIHKLIYPMRSTSDKTPYDDHNLWVIDEKLAFHAFLSSDRPLFDATTQRPDLAVFDNPIAYSEFEGPSYGSLLLVELKRPQRDDYKRDNSPISQIYDYIEQCRNGELRSHHGRTINLSQDAVLFAYVIADETKTLRDVLRNEDFALCGDGGRYYRYHQRHRAHIEVLSYDALLDIAKKRNQVLFDKLGLPTP